MRLGNYEWDPATDLIAEGSFAEVFRAKDMNTTGRTVALKIYKEAVAKGTSGGSGQKKYTLEQEFRNVDGLSHTNVITYHGLDYIRHLDAMGRESSYPVLVMEFAEGGTLTDFLKTDPDETVRDKLIGDIIQGICYLHGEGILHRDLKPGNILITRNRRGEPVPKITDFGISRDILTNKTQEQSFTEGVGTPHYMAPEQFFKRTYGLNGELSERTDLWAIGVIVYRILTGRLPFGEGVRDYELVRETVMGCDPDYSDVLDRHLPLLKSSLVAHAGRRVGTAKELLAAWEGRGGVDGMVPIPEEPSETPIWERGKQANKLGEEPQGHAVATVHLSAPIRKLISDMVRVEGGTFTMGCTPEQGGDCLYHEKPAHQVTLSSFGIGRYEVTQAQWRAVMGTDIRQQRDKANPKWELCGEGDDFPMYYISWGDVQEFVHRLSEATKKSFRLPTEAEWEYAARGGNRSRSCRYPGGDNFDEVAWYRDNSGDGTHPVGGKRPNELGLYDMGGNVWEWCGDWYGNYGGAAQASPTGPDTGTYRVYRGGSWFDNVQYCRVSSRFSDVPGFRYFDLGFRVALGL